MSSTKTLTAKQQAFVAHYLVTLNATEAAKAAGYSEKTAAVMAAENLIKPNIQKAIQDAQAKRAEKLEVDAEWVLKRLIDSVEADLDDLFNADGGIRPIGQWPDAFRKGLVAGIEVDEIRGAEGEVIGYTKKIKLSDRLRRLELIGKHIGMWKDKVEVTGEVKHNHSGELLDAIAARLRANAAANTHRLNGD